MDKRSIVSNFEAEVYDDSSDNPICHIEAIIKKKEQAKTEFDEAVRNNQEAVRAETDRFGDNFVISLGAIKRNQRVTVEFTYHVVMDLRKQVDSNNPNDFLGPAPQSFYELLLPVSFKPKYAPNTTDDIFVSGNDADTVNSMGGIKVVVESSDKLDIYNQAEENNGQLVAQENSVGDYFYEFNPTPTSIGDVNLKIMNGNNLVRNGESPFESDNLEVRLFKFSDVLKNSENPLYNKYGLVVDYAIRRRMMNELALDELPKRHHHFVIDCSG